MAADVMLKSASSLKLQNNKNKNKQNIFRHSKTFFETPRKIAR